MSFKSDLRARVLADAGVTALVGRRVHWRKRPTGDGLPTVVMHRVTPGITYTHDGQVPTTTPTIQFDVLGEDEAEVEAVADALKALFRTMTGPTAAPPFQGAFVLDERDDPLDLSPGSTASEVHRTSLDVRIVHDAA